MHCKARLQLPNLKKEEGVKSSLCFLIPISSVLFLPSLCVRDHCSNHMALRQKLGHKAGCGPVTALGRKCFLPLLESTWVLAISRCVETWGIPWAVHNCPASTPTSWGQGETEARRSLQIGRQQFKRWGNWHRSLSWQLKTARSQHHRLGS